MSKEFEFISEEDWLKHISKHPENDLYRQGVNKLLHGKCQKGYTAQYGVPEKAVLRVTKNEETSDGNRVFLFIEEIEPETVECSVCKGIRSFMDWAKFCPACGKKLS